jgi:16S rRNA (cytidine1402-2'-O)-methyltransferase
LVRAVLEAGHAVTPIPGPSALLAAVAASGLPTDAFVYLGFLPRKAGDRLQLLRSVSAEPRTLVAFESPHRLLAALEDMEAELGDRPAAVARELTKLHEEIYRGPLSAARTHFAAKEILGEITLVVAGAALQPRAVWPRERVLAEVERRVGEGERLKEAARATASQAGWAARDVYDLAARQAEDGPDAEPNASPDRT